MTINNKKSTLQAILQCKCPKCTKGNMFKSSALNMAKFNELNDACSVCGFSFRPEPGFYQISLFVTYAIGVAIFIIFGFATYYVLNDPPLSVYYITIITPAVLTTPWNLRYSKVLMLYAFG
ncbi:DUF983 domain-containing protein [Anditalea andensis]|uniref:DUF983 domain-containing protein n=1 Tax=Anditalea andensis TaxID=1048983 RepID=UPI0005503F19|nr:DUF983 domain-containing protein [Anditalea andensis]